MTEETITFELIRSIQREEQRTPKLTKIPENFYDIVSTYLAHKEKVENMKVLIERGIAEEFKVEK